jgi:transcriptional regulator of acetoin/glycerol metabolism
MRVLPDSARRYETGETRIPAEYVVAVCRAFHVSPEWLLLGADPSAPSAQSPIEEAFEQVWEIMVGVRSLEGRWPTRDPLAYVEDEWERFIGRLPPKHSLREVIVASWDRSRAAGVDATSDEATFRFVPAADLERRRGALGAFLRAAEPHLAWLSAATGRLPHVAYLVCTEGVVIHAVESDVELLDRWGLRPGADWSERVMGTNGAGTALASGKVVAVLGPEHYLRSSHRFTCLAAPVRDPSGNVLGALDLSTPFHGWRPHQLVFVAYAAEMIERDLAHMDE